MWCNDPSDEPRDLLEAVPQSRNDEDTQPEIDHISRGERLAYRKRILCCSSDKQPVSWHTLPVYAGRGVAFAPSFRTCFRNIEARNHMSPCVSANIVFLSKSEVEKFSLFSNRNTFKQEAISQRDYLLSSLTLVEELCEV